LKPAAFGPERSWLAIRTNDRRALSAALGFRALDEAPFDAALAGRDRAFVTPPIDGWTLVVIERKQPSQLFALAERASAELGEAQLFVCSAKRRHYAWLSLRDGKLERAFEEQRGNVLRDEGDRRRGEPSASGTTSENTVLEVAGSWSVDPSTLGLRADSFERGFVGLWPEPATPGPRWADVIGGVIGSVGLILIEIALILALGRLFGRTNMWWLGAAVGVALVLYASLAGGAPKLKRIVLLAGLALALGAVLGGAFPFRPE
jgi:hypothetical protein